MTSWRWRRCLRCGEVNRAGDFQVVGTYRPGWNDTGSVQRQCPGCGLTDRTDAFIVVRERRAGLEVRA